MVNFTRFDSIISLASYFSNEEICRQFLKEQRWGNVVVCPYCGSGPCMPAVTERDSSVTDAETSSACWLGPYSRTPSCPPQWFMAMYLLSSHQKGVSPIRLQGTSRWHRKPPGSCSTRYAPCLVRMIMLRLLTRWSVMRPTWAEERRTSTESKGQRPHEDAPQRPRRPCSEWCREAGKW